MLNAALSKLNAEFKEANDKKAAAVNEANRCARRLDLAQRLVSALGSEKARWANSIVELDANLEVIVGDVLLASAFVSYAGPFNKKFRNMMIEVEFLKFMKEKDIPLSAIANPVKILTTESMSALWNQ